jgi:hypothetical protein
LAAAGLPAARQTRSISGIFERRRKGETVTIYRLLTGSEVRDSL